MSKEVSISALRTLRSLLLTSLQNHISALEPAAKPVIYAIKRTTPPGPCMLGSDGVVRTFAPSPNFTVLDAVGLSPSQIK